MSLFRLADAVDLLRPDDSLGIPLGPGHPGGFLHALGERDDWSNLRIYGALLTDLYAVLGHPNVHWASGFYGPAERLMRDSGGNIDFVPADFRRFGPILEQQRPRVMATSAAPPDADGWCSLSLHAGATIAELERASLDPDRLLLVEVSPNFPRTLGLPPEHRHAVHVDAIDVLIETEASPVELIDPAPTEVETAIASFCTDFIPEGATLQTGIGGIPGAVAAQLAEGPGGGYGVHSEMFTTGLMHLHRAGKVTNTAKGQWSGYSITTFCAGTRELYDWLDGEGRELVRFLPVDVVNSQDAIAHNNLFVSINGALGLDLMGQVVADTVDGRQFSGIGGHEDFIAGAGLESEDRSLICLPSTYQVDGVAHSRIWSSLPAGSIVTTPRHQVDVVITEYGAAELSGRTVRERVAALVEIAHPDFREELSAAAEAIAS